MAGGRDIRMNETYKDSKMIAKAITAYERSSLKQEDALDNQEAIKRISDFLREYEIDPSAVTSNPFEIDGIRFYSFTIGVADLPHSVRASRKCPDCDERLTFDVVRFGHNVTPAMFGQWLVTSHICEFNEPEEKKPVVGFKATHRLSPPMLSIIRRKTVRMLDSSF
jgi:hypothetical protein